MVTYKWGSGAGADLDTFTGIVNTGVSINDKVCWIWWCTDISHHQVLQ
jgi:hypothetical protein